MRFRAIKGILHGLLKRKFVRDVLTLQAGGIMSAGINVIKSAVIFRFLGQEGYGLFAVALAMAGTLSLFTNLGQSSATLTFFSEAFYRHDATAMKRVYRYYLQLTVFTSLLIIGFIAISPMLAQLLYERSDLGMLAVLALLGLLAGSMDGLTVSILQVVREIRLLTSLENLSLLLQTIFGITLLFVFGAAGALLGFLLAMIIMAIIYLFVFHKMRKRHSLPKLREALHVRGTREFFWQGLWIAIDRNVGNLFPQVFLFLMSIFAGTAVTGIAQLAISNGIRPRSIMLPHIVRMAGSALPALAAKGSREVKKGAVQLIKHALAMHTGITLLCMVIFPPLLLFIYGEEFRPVIYPMLWVMLISVISGLNVANAPILRLYRKAHISAIFNAIVMPMELLLFLWLLTVIHPLYAIVAILFVIYCFGLWINWFVFRTLQHDHLPSASSTTAQV